MTRSGWILGILVVGVLAYIALDTLRTGPEAVGVRVGERLPPFAVPRLASGLDGDANVAPRPGKGAGASGRTPACAVRDPRALNVCRYAAGRPLVLAFAAVADDDSLATLDAMAAVAPRFPAVRFAAVVLRGDRDEARRAARDRHWRFALGWDRRADVAAVYGLKTLPAVVFADRRRRARETIYGRLDAVPMTRSVRAVAGP